MTHGLKRKGTFFRAGQLAPGGAPDDDVACSTRCISHVCGWGAYIWVNRSVRPCQDLRAPDWGWKHIPLGGNWVEIEGSMSWGDSRGWEALEGVFFQRLRRSISNGICSVGAREAAHAAAVGETTTGNKQGTRAYPGRMNSINHERAIRARRQRKCRG